MITVTITNDKTVHIQNDSSVYEGENLIDIIHINICEIIESVNISGFSFLFDYINVNNVGDSIQLNDYAVVSTRDDFLAFEIPVTNELTSRSGKIKYWIRIIDAASSLIIKTAEREITIIDHVSITDLIPEQSLTLLDQWQVYMDNTLSELESYNIHPPIPGENGHWFIWNGTVYTDSGNSALGAPDSGTTANRPTIATVGYTYFDTTLGKPIWLKTAPSTWVDSAGTTV